MAKNVSSEVTQLFGRARARDYDRGIPKRIPGYASLHTTAYALLESNLPARAELLVVGAGTGQELVHYAQAQPTWSLLGVDPSAEMLSHAREKVVEAGLSERVRLKRCTVDALPVVEMYDAATALLVMHFLPDDGSKEEFLHGIAARLKSDAPMLLADMSGRPGSPEFELLFAAWKVHWREEHGLEPDDESLEKEFAERRIRLGWIDEKRHLELFKQAGFGKPVRFWSGLLFSGWYLRKR